MRVGRRHNFPQFRRALRNNLRLAETHVPSLPPAMLHVVHKTSEKAVVTAKRRQRWLALFTVAYSATSLYTHQLDDAALVWIDIAVLQSCLFAGIWLHHTRFYDLRLAAMCKREMRRRK